jgi:GTPase SAR1 family protein
MNISLKKGKPIAINTTTNEVIRLNDTQEEKKIDEPFEIISEKDIRKNKKKMSVLEMNRLKSAFKSKAKPEDEQLARIYEELTVEMTEKASKIYNAHEGELMLLPTPKKNDRIYIAGSTGVGKSTFILAYLKQYLKIYPDKDIYLFSDVLPEDDKVLTQIPKIKRIKLNQSLVTNPIQTPELEHSCTIFDDVDSISDKSIKKAVITLYDAILKKGSSKNDITLIITNHAMSDYTATRNILINCNYIVFYPQSPVGVEYTLKKFGLNKEQIGKLLAVPSRWCVLHKNFPFYAVSSKSVFLL